VGAKEDSAVMIPTRCDDSENMAEEERTNEESRTTRTAKRMEENW
jgi:hypothetical protein